MKIRCPMCGKEEEVADDFEFRPFCSARCKKVDLLNWLEGNYRLPRALTPEELDALSPEEREKVLEQAMDEQGLKPIH
ncbi:MAG: DNA gyrase inhibitor YacG [Polyangiaceae bacterium]|nr:DNA gyrase inhibitor YacG [Polyangiaceae bacterium]